MVVFSNIGFMGFPLLTAMYGSEAVLYAAIFTLPYNLLIYTYGISMLETDTREEKGETKRIPWKKIFNIGVIACIIAVILYFVRPTVPVFLEDAIDRLGSLTAPLSMLVIGDAMANSMVKPSARHRPLMQRSFSKPSSKPLIS